MTTMTMPAAELAEKALREVGYEDRIVGLKMSAMGGANPSDLHSLEQVARFIHVGDYETALRDNHATVGYMDPAALARWASEVLGDTELADAIGELSADGAFYGTFATSLKQLLLERVQQYRAALAPAEPEPADAAPLD